MFAINGLPFLAIVAATILLARVAIDWSAVLAAPGPTVGKFSAVVRRAPTRCWSSCADCFHRYGSLGSTWAGASWRSSHQLRASFIPRAVSPDQRGRRILSPGRVGMRSPTLPPPGREWVAARS